MFICWQASKSQDTSTLSVCWWNPLLSLTPQKLEVGPNTLSIIGLTTDLCLIKSIRLDKYVFCGQAYSPTSNYLTLVEKIPGNSKIPLGKILLGALYNLLNRVSQHLMHNEIVPTITGRWWLLRLWLNLHLHKLVAPELINMSFPSMEYLE